MTSPGSVASDEVTAADGWCRLDARVLAVFPLRQVTTLLPVLVVVLLGGRGQAGWQLAAAVVAPAALVAYGVLRWLTVRYRVGEDRVELRSGLLNRQHRSVRRDRVRTVDLTASPVHRLFRLSVVEIGTGSQAGRDGRLSLDAVPTAEGERLRRELLDRSPVAGLGPDGAPAPAPDAGPTPATGPGTSPGTEVARLRPAWARFAPLTASGLVALGAIAGTAFQLAGDFGVRPSDLDVVSQAGDRLTAVPTWVSAAVLTAVVLCVGSLGSLAIWVESWWGYRLTREPDGTLLLRRGLLTTRSLAIEQTRMRGAAISQSLPLRLFGGARCAAVTTGLDAKASIGGALLPPAPLAEAHRVAAAALLLDDPAAATAAPLRRHPAAALRRRLTRAGVPAAALTAGAWWAAGWAPGLAPLWPAALLLVPLAVVLGLDRYRGLGHALGPEYLVIAQGSLWRRRVALERRGVIGWRVRQSPFQRRAGLVTLDAVTAAGGGRYSVVDLPMGWATALVDQVDPGLLPLAADPVPAGARPATPGSASPGSAAASGAEEAAGDLPAGGAGR